MTDFAELLRETAEVAPDDPEYGAYISFNLRAVDRGRRIVALLAPRPGQTAIDVGAGSGGTAIALAEAGCSVVAIEPDPLRHTWAQTRTRGYDVEVRRASAEELPFPDASFDHAVLDNVIEHVDDPARTLSEIHRVLKPGGRLYLAWPNKFSLLAVLRDPHYRMLGVVLMPPRLGRFYVERVRRNPRGYWVNVVPTRRWVRRHWPGELRELPFDGAEKLDRPEDISDRYARVRRVAVAAKRVGLARPLGWVIQRQSPAHKFLATKRERGAAAAPLRDG